MNTKLILLSLFTVLYFLGTQWWYSNKISGVCCGGEKVEEVAETPPPTKVNLPLAFKWDAAQPILGDNHKAYIDNTILKGMEDGKVLQITGYYYKDEGAQEGFDNAGLARAAAIRELIKESVPVDRVDISSRLATDTETMKDLPFEGASYNWRAELKKEEAGPMLVCYELGIVGARMVEGRRAISDDPGAGDSGPDKSDDAPEGAPPPEGS